MSLQRYRFWSLLAAALFLSSCEEPPRLLARLAEPSAPERADSRVSSAIPSGREQLQIVESRGLPETPRLRGAKPLRSEPGDITLSFIDTDIREIVRVVLGQMLKVNFTIDPTVQGTATLETSRPVPRSQLLSTLETLLTQNGATLTYRDGIYRVSPQAAAIAAPVASTGVGAFSSGAQIVPLRYASAGDLAKLLEPYVTAGGKISADPGRNALIISGDPNVRQALLAMVRAFDIDVLAGQSYALFPAGDASAEKLAGELEKVFRSEGDGPLSGVVHVVPLQRVNAVLVASSQPRYIAEARRFFGLQQRAEDATTRAWHVYYVQNGQSTDLENLLQRAFTPGRVSTTATSPGTTAPEAQTVSLSSPRGTTSSGSAGLGVGRTGAGAGSGSAPGGLGSGSVTASDAAARDRATATAEASSSQTDTGSEGRMRIIANRRNNALLIYATPSEYAMVEGMLRKIDIVPLQVLIEATIAEVTLNDQLNYGTQFFLGGKLTGTLSSATSGQTNPVATIAGIPIGYAPNFPGFVLANGVREVINALATITKVKVLSAPQVMVLDNEPARLQVGNIVPVLTQSQQSTLTANAPIVNSIDYRDTGVILLVTPRVNSSGLVTLDLSQEVSDVLSQTTGNINSPTFDQRLIRTRVAVQDGQTVGLAGLIRDSDTEGNSGIPLVKDIPLLGSLVSSQQNSRQRTELLVLITPHVVHNQQGARALTEDLRDDVVNAALVKQDLQTKPLHGSPNPNRF